MKQISTFLLFVVMLSSSPVFAQKNTVNFGVFYLPVSENDIVHGGLGFYRHLEGKHSVGVKAMFSTFGLGPNYEGVQLKVGNIDLVHRWTFSKNKGRYKVRLDAGISLSGVREKAPPFYYGFCGSGETEAKIWAKEREIERRRNDVLFRGGLASSVNWEWAISRGFGLGIGTNFNVYYTALDGWQLLPMPNVNAAYSF